MYALRQEANGLLFSALLLACVLGVLVGQAPGIAVVAISLGVFLVWVGHIIQGFRLWQTLTFFSLAGYVVLNYGFANLTLPLVQTPLPVGHLCAFGALLLVWLERKADMRAFLHTPVAVWLLLFFGLACLRLSVDIPAAGLYALRDANFVFESLFLFLGFAWAQRGEDIAAFLKILGAVFGLNFVYALTFPLGTMLQTHSPVSGIFSAVPVVGFYAQTSLFLLAGAVFALLVMKHRVTFTTVPLLYACVQIGWTIIFQNRSAYLGSLIVIGLLFVFSGVRRGLKVGGSVLLGMVLLFGALWGIGIGLEGRIGPVQPEFLVQHFQSLFLTPDTPAVGSIMWRLQLFADVWNDWTTDLYSIVFGQGFGQPLVQVSTADGIPVRQPHNTHLTILARLGLVGAFLWVGLQWQILKRFLGGLRRYRRDSFAHDLVLWCFLFYVLGLFVTSVQPWLEFSYGAIPFSLIVGFALGVLQHEDLNCPQPVPTTRW